MKFNWGTGILIVLIVFLLACAGFIFFAFNQDVNLVHRDYYEKGVDYSGQMKIDARSVQFADSVNVIENPDFYSIIFKPSLASKIDSANILFYYAANSKMDFIMPFDPNKNQFQIAKDELKKGRYKLKIFWFSGGLKYETDKTIQVK